MRDMLSCLRIKNIAILDEVELELGPALTVLTGETGAGKSLILDAVALLRGGRAPADLIRTGAEEARIEAVFNPPPGSEVYSSLLERLGRVGIDSASVERGDGLLIRRVISREARKSRVYIAEQLASVSALGEVVGGLIDIAGQHEHQSLLDTSRHLYLLDRADPSPSGIPETLRKEMAAAFEQLSAAASAVRAASVDERTRAEREEFLRFQLDELATVDPQPGEDDRLREEQKRLRSAERLVQAARRGEDTLYNEEGSVLERIGTLRQKLAEAATLDRELGVCAEDLLGAEALVEDVALRLRRYADALRADPERLTEIDERLHALSRLLRKHGPDLATVIARRAEMEAALCRLTEHEAHRAEADAALDLARDAAKEAARRLSAARAATAMRLGKAATAVLADLGMGGARIEAVVSPRSAQRGDEDAFLFACEGGGARRITREGWDRVELMLESNLGEEARPLAKIASGGELSRVMLALRSVMGQGDSVGTMVFDEVDAGIGGQTADRVGRHVRALARDGNRQVLCITHAGQIAAYAEQHLHVEKQVSDGRTSTRVRELSPQERREEMARMLGGARLTERSLLHADELLREASLPRLNAPGKRQRMAPSSSKQAPETGRERADRRSPRTSSQGR